MKKSYLYIIAVMMTVLAGALSSCSETNDDSEEFANWQQNNADYFDQAYANAKSLAATSSDCKVIRSYLLRDDSGNNKDKAYNSYDHIIVNVLNEGKGSGCPLYTDSVKVHYSGHLLPSKSYPQGYVFDQSWNGDYNLATMMPSKFAVAGTVTGFATALQYMHIGDRWQITIPQQLAYGSDDTPGAAYSTLIFDVTLVAYYRADDTSWMKTRVADDGDNAPKGRWIYE